MTSDWDALTFERGDRDGRWYAWVGNRMVPGSGQYRAKWEARFNAWRYRRYLRGEAVTPDGQ
jgi:hypothetical protein